MHNREGNGAQALAAVVFGVGFVVVLIGQLGGVMNALGRVDVHQLSLDEHLEYRATKGLCECRDVVEREVHESAVWTEPPVGDQHM